MGIKKKVTVMREDSNDEKTIPRRLRITITQLKMLAMLYITLEAFSIVYFLLLNF